MARNPTCQAPPSPSSSSSGSGRTTGCCTPPVPTTLHVTIGANTSEPCADCDPEGTTFPIVYVRRCMNASVARSASVQRKATAFECGKPLDT